MFNKILEGSENFPESLKGGRISLLPKPDSEPGHLEEMRPMTVLPVIYRVFMGLLNIEIQKWVEENNIIASYD